MKAFSKLRTVWGRLDLAEEDLEDDDEDDLEDEDESDLDLFLFFELVK